MSLYDDDDLPQISSTAAAPGWSQVSKNIFVVLKIYLKDLKNISTPGCKAATDPAAAEEGDARGHGDVSEAGHGLARRVQQEALAASRQGLQEEQERLRQQCGGQQILSSIHGEICCYYFHRDSLMK